MKWAALGLLALTAALARPAQQQPVESVQRETLQEAARNARRLTRDVLTGTMASVFPGSAGDNAGRPFALMDPRSCPDAPCHNATSLTFISFPISLTAHNIFSAPSHDATYTLQMPVVKGVSEFSRARVAFIGNLTMIREPPADEQARLAQCFTQHHPDARFWLPGDPDGAHTSVWSRLDIHDIYYVGGFGSTHYVGHIPVDMYASADELVD